MVGQDGAQGVVVVARREACDGVDQLALQRLELPRLLDELLARGELGLDAPVPLEERDVHADEREHEHTADRDPGLPAGEEALAVANDTPMGLVAGIVTTSLKYAAHFKRYAEAGMVMVNLPTAGVDFHVPFGGRKASSYGPREQGRYAAEFYTTVKTAYTFAG